MYTFRTKTLTNLDFMTLIVFCISLFSLSIIAFESQNFAPIFLYIIMVLTGMLLTILFSNKHEFVLKITLFVFFFSFYLSYTLIHHYILLSLFPNLVPVEYLDEKTLYYFSNLGLPFISGEKNFFEIFSVFKISELPLHVVFTSIIAYFSILIDGSNTIIVQKLLSPFLGGLFSIVLYSTLKYHFKDHSFAFKSTFAYSLLSAIFMYSTPMLRDIDVALVYMIFFYIFLKKNSLLNFFLLLIIAYITIYLRVESGMVLFALILLYSYTFTKNIKSWSIKLIFYIFLIGLFMSIFTVMFGKIIGMISHLNEANVARSINAASSGSIGVLLNKLPFPLSYIAKVFFGQLQPFPLFMSLDKPAYAISGISWPFIFLMMCYAILKKSIRTHITMKVQYLWIVAITILFLMSSEPMTRRMLSVYPIIYIVSLYVFQSVSKRKIKILFYYYIFGMIVLHIFYYFIKV